MTVDNEVDNEQLTKCVKPYMILTGTWKLNLKNTPFSRRSYKWYSLGFQGIFFLFLSLLLFKSVQLIHIRADVQTVISNMSIVVSGFAVWMKIFLYQNNKVPEMFQEIIKEEENILLSLDDDFIVPYLAKTKFCKKICMGIIINVSFATGSLFLVSLANFILTDNEMKKTEKMMIQESFMYPFWLPYKEQEIMTSVIILNALFAFVSICLFSVSHMIFATLMVFCATQLELLQIKISKLNWKANEGDLIAIIIRHSSLIRFIETVNQSTKYVIFVDFLLNSLTVASVAVQVIRLKMSLQLIFPIAYLGILVMQVFALGWLANEIKVQSTAIADVLYQTNWYNQDTKSRKIFHVMLMRSQKPLKMSIGPFGAMTTETALATMQAAYSYITLMQNYN